MAEGKFITGKLRMFYNDIELPVSPEEQENISEQLREKSEPGYISQFNPMRQELEDILAPLDDEDLPDFDKS